jgi:signal transduction histidine kinase
MSIRLKLLFSYAAMLVIPLFLMILTALLLVVVFRGDLQNLKSLYESKMEGFDDGEFHHLIKHTIDQNPSLLSDPNYLHDISSEMKPKDSFLVVRVNGQFIYLSETIRQKTELISVLPTFEHAGFRDQEPAKYYGNELYSTNQYDFVSSNHQPASLYILTKIDPFAYFARKFFPILFICLLVILIVTHSLLTYFMSKAIIRPLQELRKSAKLIEEGHLDFKVQVQGMDEIGQLGVAFEDMRSRLQQSIRLQLQYEENRKELISNISHDLKTPITAIKGYVDGIMEGVADSPSKTEKYMTTISAKATEMDHLIDELFLYSKLDLKRIPFSFEPVNVHAFLLDWAEELRFELDKMGVRLESEIAIVEVVQVWIDRDKFNRVLSNVIQNSMKYMDKEDKLIRLRASTSELTVKMEIADNGPGIESDALPFIFDRFYRAEQSRNANTGGSGLGLAIAKQIMEGHGGDIRAESLKGEGTLIILTLPYQKEGQAQ